MGGQDSYSDDSFADEEKASSEEERTPTFEFHISPPSIANSGPGGSHEPLSDVKVQYPKDDDTASDVSELENQPVSCEEPNDISGGILQRKQSDWKLFDDISNETDHEAAKSEMLEVAEAIEYDHHRNAKVIEMNTIANVVADEELDRMDEDILSLLRSSSQPSRKTVTGSQQVSTVYPGNNDVENNSETESVSGRRKVRITIEPEVFLVPFSSREFDEPFFDDTDKTPAGEVVELGLKNLNLDPFSQEFRADLYDSVEEDIPEEITLEAADHEEKVDLVAESSGFNRQGKEPDYGNKGEDEAQSPSELNTTDKNGPAMGDELLTNSENFSVEAVDKKEDMPACEVKKESPFKNVNFDPYSQEFVDDLEDLLDDAEEDIQNELISMSTTEIEVVVVSNTNGFRRKNEELNNSSKVNKETQSPSKLNFAGDDEFNIDQEFKIDEGEMQDELHCIAQNCSVKDEGTDILAAGEVEKDTLSKGIQPDPYSPEVVNNLDNVEDLLDSMEEDITEEITSEENNNLDEKASMDAHSVHSTSSIKINQAQALIETKLSSEISIAGRRPKYHEEKEEAFLEQKKQHVDAILDAAPVHERNTTIQLSVDLLSYSGNNEPQPVAEETDGVGHQGDGLFFQDAHSGSPVVFTGEREKEDCLRDENLVPMSTKCGNDIVVTEQGNEGGGDTGVAKMQTSTEGLLDTEDADTERLAVMCTSNTTAMKHVDERKDYSGERFCG